MLSILLPNSYRMRVDSSPRLLASYPHLPYTRGRLS